MNCASTEHPATAMFAFREVEEFVGAVAFIVTVLIRVLYPSFM
jgi:hypothetical protein